MKKNPETIEDFKNLSVKSYKELEIGNILSWRWY